MKNILDYLKKDLMRKCKVLEYSVEGDYLYTLEDTVNEIQELVPMIRQLKYTESQTPQGWKEIEA